jgi:outer membrane lipoprotein-sorting protein
MTLSVEKVTFNQPLPDEQFISKVPEGYKVQRMP